MSTRDRIASGHPVSEAGVISKHDRSGPRPAEHIYVDKRTGANNRTQGLEGSAWLRPSRGPDQRADAGSAWPEHARDPEPRARPHRALAVDTSEPVPGTDMAIALLAVFAQMERIYTLERAAGARAAKEARGRPTGRPAKLNATARAGAAQRIKGGAIPEQVAAEPGVSRSRSTGNYASSATAPLPNLSGRARRSGPGRRAGRDVPLASRRVPYVAGSRWRPTVRPAAPAAPVGHLTRAPRPVADGPEGPRVRSPRPVDGGHDDGPPAAISGSGRLTRRGPDGPVAVALTNIADRPARPSDAAPQVLWRGPGHLPATARRTGATAPRGRRTRY